MPDSMPEQKARIECQIECQGKMSENICHTNFQMMSEAMTNFVTVGVTRSIFFRTGDCESVLFALLFAHSLF